MVFRKKVKPESTAILDDATLYELAHPKFKPTPSTSSFCTEEYLAKKKRNEEIKRLNEERIAKERGECNDS